MKKAQFSNDEVATAAAEFQTYMAPRVVEAGGKNGPVTVYGENSNTRKPKLMIFDDEEDDSGLLQEFSNTNFRIE